MIYTVNQHGAQWTGGPLWASESSRMFAGTIREKLLALRPLGLLSWEDEDQGGPPWRGLPEKINTGNNANYTLSLSNRH